MIFPENLLSFTMYEIHALGGLSGIVYAIKVFHIVVSRDIGSVNPTHCQ